ncbi:MAG: N-acetyltransferase family protein [Pseudomonadota bacterium]
MASVLIREARSDDQEALVGLMAELQEAERALEPDRAPGAEIARSHLHFLLGEVAATGGFVVVAEVSGRVAGFLLILVETDGGTYVRPECRRHAAVADLVVTADARGRGIGRALLAAAEERVRTAGLASIRLALLADNAAAERLYRRLGYRRYEVVMRKRLDTDEA